MARDRARSFNEKGGQGLFVDQFENPLNWLTHYQLISLSLSLSLSYTKKKMRFNIDDDGFLFFIF